MLERRGWWIGEERRLSLLLADDDVELAEMLRLYFAGAGHRVECVHNGVKGIASVLRGTYDLAILDVMLPAIDAMSLRGSYPRA
ncbi:MAG TPA: response regulator [Acidobacteriaceae bacterium]